MSIAHLILALAAVVLVLVIAAAVVLSLGVIGSMARAPRDDARRARRAAARRPTG